MAFKMERGTIVTMADTDELDTGGKKITVIPA